MTAPEFEEKNMEKDYSYIEKKGDEVVIRIDDSIFTQDPEELTADGNLPEGWIERHKTVTDPISSVYHKKNYVLGLSSYNESEEEILNLGDLSEFVDLAEHLCAKHGDTYLKWFYTYIISEKSVANYRNVWKQYNDSMKSYLRYELRDSEGIVESRAEELFEYPHSIQVVYCLKEMVRDGELVRLPFGDDFIYKKK